MAKAVATVGVSVVARTKNFRRGMKRAQSRLKRFSASVRGISKRVAKFGAVLGAVAGGAMAVMVKRSFTAIDATTKLADRMRLPVTASVASPIRFDARLRIGPCTITMQRLMADRYSPMSRIGHPRLSAA